MIKYIQDGEIDKLFHLGEMFSCESRLIGKFNREIFKKNWQAFLKNGIGVIIAFEENGNAVGALGALKFEDVNTGIPTSQELFWYVHPDHRGIGLQLLSEFEKWSKQEGCQRIYMTYLVDSMPEQVKSIYERRGYKQMEVNYILEV